MDHYTVLGVSRNASKDEIKRAYRKLAMQFHPDKHANSPDHLKQAATSKFKLINKAYDTLMDDRSRSDYNVRQSANRNHYNTNYNTNSNTNSNANYNTNSHYNHNSYYSRKGNYYSYAFKGGGVGSLKFWITFYAVCEVCDLFIKVVGSHVREETEKIEKAKKSKDKT